MWMENNTRLFDIWYTVYISCRAIASHSRAPHRSRIKFHPVQIRLVFFFVRVFIFHLEIGWIKISFYWVNKFSVKFIMSLHFGVPEQIVTITSGGFGGSEDVDRWRNHSNKLCDFPIESESFSEALSIVSKAMSPTLWLYVFRTFPRISQSSRCGIIKSSEMLR